MPLIVCEVLGGPYADDGRLGAGRKSESHDDELDTGLGLAEGRLSVDEMFQFKKGLRRVWFRESDSLDDEFEFGLGLQGSLIRTLTKFECAQSKWVAVSTHQLLWP